MSDETKVTLDEAERQALTEARQDARGGALVREVERIVRERMASVWDEGRGDRHTIECRFEGSPDDCICPNPYRVSRPGTTPEASDV